MRTDDALVRAVRVRNQSGNVFARLRVEHEESRRVSLKLRNGSRAGPVRIGDRHAHRPDRCVVGRLKIDLRGADVVNRRGFVVHCHADTVETGGQFAIDNFRRSIPNARGG